MNLSKGLILGEHVTQEQLNSTMLTIHQSIRDGQRQSDVRFSELAHHMENIADRLAKSHEQRLDQHSRQIDGLQSDVKELGVHSTKTKVYWSIFGTILIILSGVVVKLLFP